LERKKKRGKREKRDKRRNCPVENSQAWWEGGQAGKRMTGKHAIY